MRWSGSSYIGAGRERQSPPLVRPILVRRPIAVAALAASLGGCAGLGMPPGEFAHDQRDLTTGSIQKVSMDTVAKVDQSDWEAVRVAIAEGSGGKRTGAVDWQNPKTGSAGTVTMLGTTPATNDPNCRTFATTMNDTRGIRRYRGEACVMANGQTQLFGILADDSQLL